MRRALLYGPPLAFSSYAYLEPPTYKEKIRGTYENKIRQNAPPEKIFETFASVKEGKKFYMTLNDFFYAITPFNYSKGKDQDFFEQHESLVFKMADGNGDGKMSFTEYFFFIVLLSTGASVVKPFFDSKGGKVTKEQFMELMNQAKKTSNQGRSQVDSGSMIDPRSTNLSEEEYLLSCQKLAELLFKGNEYISWHDFVKLKNLIQEELLFYEFHQFEVDESDMTISAEDFAKSIISYLPTSKVDDYLRRIEKLKFEGKVTYEEYLAFMHVLCNTKSLQKALLTQETEGRGLSRVEIRKALNQLCEESAFIKKNNLSISNLQVTVFMKLLDLDDSGYLEPEEFFNILVSRNFFGTNQPGKPSTENFLRYLKVKLNKVIEKFGFEPYFSVEDYTEIVGKTVKHSSDYDESDENF